MADYGTSNDQKFYTRQNDHYTDEVDYAMMRYYFYSHAAFMSPDRSMANIHLANPQSWNAYMYVNGDPINYIDPSGHEMQDAGNGCTWNTQTNALTCPNGGNGGTTLNPSDPDFCFLNPSAPICAGRVPTGQPAGGSDIGNTQTTTTIETNQCRTSGDALTLAAGVFDSLSFGLAPRIHGWLWYDDPVGIQDTTYQSGYAGASIAELGLGGARLAYAGTAKGISLLARSGQAASAARNTLKVAAGHNLLVRFGLTNRRLYSYEQMLAKYSSDPAVQAAAGRTNALANWAGAGGFINGLKGFFGSYQCE